MADGPSMWVRAALNALRATLRILTRLITKAARTFASMVRRGARRMR